MVVEVRLEDLDGDDRAHFADKAEVGSGTASGSAWLTIRLRASISPVDSERLDFDRSSFQGSRPRSTFEQPSPPSYTRSRGPSMPQTIHLWPRRTES